MSAVPSASAASRPAHAVRLMACLICCASMGLHLYPLLCPALMQDDFQILARGATWQRTQDEFWVPQNEHAMPLGRLLTFGLLRVGGRATLLPWTAGLVGPLALLAALPLVYLLVRRELGHPFYGLVAAALFGVSSVYQQAVYWFAASFSVLTLDTMLLALLAAQRWRQTGRRRYLLLSALACFLAPGWFASGVLAGPLCALYLIWPRPTAACGFADTTAKPQAAVVIPLLGTALFLAISLPLTAAHLRRLEHYHGQPLLKAFDPIIGLGYTARSVVDNLLLGVVGVSTVSTPVPLVVIILLLLTGAAAVWWRAPTRPLLLLGLGLIGAGYLLVYSARASWDYEQMTQPNWSRYHLLPQLGLTLFVVGGLPAWQGRRFVLLPGGLTRRQVGALTLLVVALFLIQLPRALLGYFVPLPGIERFAGSAEVRAELVKARERYDAQRATLQRIAAVEDRCRAHGLDAAAVRTALPKLSMPGWFTDDADGWLLLRGSDGPCHLTPDEVQKLLEMP